MSIMQSLLWSLLIALAAFGGVKSQAVDCSYDDCTQLVNNIDRVRVNTTEYCTALTLAESCVDIRLEGCGHLNVDIGFSLLSQLNEKPVCLEEITPTPTSSMDSTPTPSMDSTPTPSVDCTYTTCIDLFHALNPNDTNYCMSRAAVSECLDNTYNVCPGRGSLHNYDITVGELDLLPSCDITSSVSATPTPTIASCTPCDDLFDALDSSDTDYCKSRIKVDDCLHNALTFCPEESLSNVLFILVQLDSLPLCNVTTSTVASPIPSPSPTSCLNTVSDINAYVELNDALPYFADQSKNDGPCSTRQEENFYHCSFYSYSHLIPFGSKEFYTCSSPGLWALFSHPSLKVTVFDLVPDQHGPYTLVDELSVVISASNCSQEISYYASAVRDYFPSTFEDGTNGVNGLELHLNSNGTTAYIWIPWISVTIVIHKLAGHIGIAMQSPISVADESIGLCTLGCPEHSKITLRPMLAATVSEPCPQEAIVACSINQLAILDNQFSYEAVTDLYFDKCRFDVLQSKNPNSSWITLAMVNSWISLGPIGTPPTTAFGYQYQQGSKSQSQTANNTETEGSSKWQSSHAAGSSVILHTTLVTWWYTVWMLYLLFS